MAITEKHRDIYDIWKQVRELADLLTDGGFCFPELLQGVDGAHLGNDYDDAIQSTDDNRQAAQMALDDLADDLAELLPREVFQQLRRGSRT